MQYFSRSLFFTYHVPAFSFLLNKIMTYRNNPRAFDKIRLCVFWQGNLCACLNSRLLQSKQPSPKDVCLESESIVWILHKSSTSILQCEFAARVRPRFFDSRPYGADRFESYSNECSMSRHHTFSFSHLHLIKLKNIQGILVSYDREARKGRFLVTNVLMISCWCDSWINFLTISNFTNGPKCKPQPLFVHSVFLITSHSLNSLHWHEEKWNWSHASTRPPPNLPLLYHVWILLFVLRFCCYKNIRIILMKSKLNFIIKLFIKILHLNWFFKLKWTQ